MEMFTFDYYLRSRTAAEIGRRRDSLMSICDNADLEYREKKEHDVRHVLQEQRAKLDCQLFAARADVKQHQARVGELIMKEAKRMLIQREAERAKKRKERDYNEATCGPEHRGTRVFPSKGNEYGCREGHARLLCKN
ncbi:unnamed protein product [Phytophthora lilii]|uniref:Unnamed protein product n=1 Tax=Phytophthora lilii TaxID=2077276 RepID=A0A9W6U0M8_9STRA|nr:unnamed protein product [Phytophthora lilii]